MSILPITFARSRAPAEATLSPPVALGLFALVVIMAAIAGFLATDAGTAQAATMAAGPDLTRLLRLMMLIKAALAAAAAGAALWRLKWPVSLARFAAYTFAGATMVAGPGLIWGMAHVGLGALLLHAGLAATIVLLWRDPAVSSAMEAALRKRAARR